MDNKVLQYFAGFCDGDASICIGKCRDGYQLKFELTQCNRDFLDNVISSVTKFGKIYKDSRDYKYLTENASTLRLCGAISEKVMHVMKEYSIIKYKQAEVALEYIPLINTCNKSTEKQQR